jgi:hypothetical protein
MELSYNEKMLLKYKGNVFTFLSLTWQIDLLSVNDVQSKILLIKHAHVHKKSTEYL